MSSREQRRDEFEKQWEAESQERARKENLTMYDRIEESDASDDVKDILHRLALHAGLES